MKNETSTRNLKKYYLLCIEKGYDTKHCYVFFLIERLIAKYYI